MSEDMILFTNKMLSEKVFNCAKCDSLLKLPITVVENVGNVCGDCVCNYSLHGFQNEKLEAILGELKLPCKFLNKGCKEYVIFKDLEQHENNCKFQTKLCLMSNEGCKWEGIQSDFSNHFIENHSEHVINNLDNLFTIELDLIETTNTIKLLKNKKECFIFKIKKSDDSNFLLYTVCSTKAGEYDGECTIKHVGENGNCVETKCQISPLNSIHCGNFNTTIDLNALKLVTKAVKILTLVIALPTSIDVKELDEKMLQYFECPVCKNLMKPPIYQCKFGHSFCNICRPKLEKCPTCRGIFGSTRNYSLEGLTASIQYSCVYHHLGCEETLSAGDANKHETACIFKPYPCPVSECNYQGNHSTIVSHLNELHSDIVIRASFYKTTSEYRLDQMMDFYNFCQRFFMIFDDNIFRLSFKRNTDYSFWAVEVLRKYDENATYVYEIGIIDMRRQDRKLIRTDLCFNETCSEDLFKKCILFPNNILSSYASNGMFTYYCQIHKR